MQLRRPQQTTYQVPSTVPPERLPAIADPSRTRPLLQRLSAHVREIGRSDDEVIAPTKASGALVRPGGCHLRQRLR